MAGSRDCGDDYSQSVECGEFLALLSKFSLARKEFWYIKLILECLSLDSFLRNTIQFCGHRTFYLTVLITKYNVDKRAVSNRNWYSTTQPVLLPQKVSGSFYIILINHCWCKDRLVAIFLHCHRVCCNFSFNFAAVSIQKPAYLIILVHT
jgi:hypothetical protein